MSPSQVADAAAGSPDDDGLTPDQQQEQQQEQQQQQQQQQEAAAGGAADNKTPNGRSAFHSLWKENGAKAKRVVKLLRRKRQKQQKQQQQQQQDAAAAAAAETAAGGGGISKKELLAAVPLRSKHRDLLLPLGRNKKLKKKLQEALEVNEREVETESEDEEETESEGEGSDTEAAAAAAATDAAAAGKGDSKETGEIEVEFVPAEEAEGAEGAIAQLAEAFSNVFEFFSAANKTTEKEAEEEEEEETLGARGEILQFDDEEGDTSGVSSSVSFPRRLTAKDRRQSRPSICELKQKTARPDRIEAWDATSADPFFLAFLKGLRNVVAVPQHWSQKRRYLQWKRGFEKPPFKLPPHIEATKISEVRSALVAADALKTVRQKMREKVRPKANRLSIDYQVLHDCFFKHAVKPPLTKMGDLYYEGKEFIIAKKHIKPGALSDRLKEALGMGPLSPPPWLLNMQRYGPPPSYPRLRIPGLNSPIPAGASYGYQPGGWGRPPVDETGALLFQTEEQQQQQQEEEGGEGMPQDLWGELPPDEEVQDEEQEEEGGAADGGPGTAETPFVGGTSSVSISTLGLESPASLELQQRHRAGVSSVSSSVPRPFTVLTPQDVTINQGELFGVRHTYRIPAGALQQQQQRQQQMQQQQQLPGSGVQTPAGLSSGMASQLASGLASPLRAGGLRSPFPASGANTPLMSQLGRSTPFGVTVSLNPNEMEQEGALPADVIRQQLRQHEEAAARAKAAAGQIDLTEQRKRKGDPLRGVSTTAAKSKKKKQFKF